MKKFMIAGVLVLLVSAVSAQTLRVVLWYQADPALPEESAERMSEALIQGSLDACFESGVIGTNDRPKAGVLETMLAYRPGQDAVDGFVDYELIVFADFTRNGTAYKTPDCTYRLIRVSDLDIRHSAMLPAIPGSTAQETDVDKACMLMGAEMTRIGWQNR